MIMKKKTAKKSYPERAKDVPVTQQMLYLVRDELKADLKSIEHRVDGRLEKMSADIHAIKILVEEQNAKNNIVLDGLTNLFHRQDRIEKLVEGS